MIIDTSAMVAIFYGEPEAAAFTQLIHDSAASRISVANYLELFMVIEKQLGPEGTALRDVEQYTPFMPYGWVKPSGWILIYGVSRWFTGIRRRMPPGIWPTA